MPPRYLLDTNSASYIIKGNVPRVRERLLKVPMSQVLISAVTEAELLFGAARKREAVRLKTAIDEFLLRADSLPWHPDGKFGYDDRGSRIGCRSHFGKERSFFSPIHCCPVKD